MRDAALSPSRERATKRNASADEARVRGLCAHHPNTNKEPHMPRTNEKPSTVELRILPQGDGKVFTGEYDSTAHEFTKYKRGDVVSLAEDIARALEARGFAEIL